MSNRSRRKGARVELEIAKLIGARKVSRAYQAGHDLELEVGDDRTLHIEVKCRADGFRELYGWLDGRDALIVKADRRVPLVVVRLPLAAELINGADQVASISERCTRQISSSCAM
jgi:hypothetical protein